MRLEALAFCDRDYPAGCLTCSLARLRIWLRSVRLHNHAKFARALRRVYAFDAYLHDHTMVVLAQLGSYGLAADVRGRLVVPAHTSLASLSRRMLRSY